MIMSAVLELFEILQVYIQKNLSLCTSTLLLNIDVNQ